VLSALTGAGAARDRPRRSYRRSDHAGEECLHLGLCLRVMRHADPPPDNPLGLAGSDDRGERLRLVWRAGAALAWWLGVHDSDGVPRCSLVRRCPQTKAGAGSDAYAYAFVIGQAGTTTALAVAHATLVPCAVFPKGTAKKGEDQRKKGRRLPTLPPFSGSTLIRAQRSRGFAQRTMMSTTRF
jgi:hypothetical protein